MQPSFITVKQVLGATGLPTDYSVISQEDLGEHARRAEVLVERLLNVRFTPDTAAGITVTDEYYDGTGTDTFFVKNTPLNAITALSVSTDAGTTFTSITPARVWTYSQSGKVVLKPTAEVSRFSDTYPQSVKVSYRHGLVPDEGIKRLMIVVAGMAALVEQLGGTFDDVTSYRLPEYEVSKGEPYTNIRETIAKLQREYDTLIAMYPPRSVVC